MSGGEKPACMSENLEVCLGPDAGQLWGEGLDAELVRVLSLDPLVKRDNVFAS